MFRNAWVLAAVLGLGCVGVDGNEGDGETSSDSSGGPDAGSDQDGGDGDGDGGDGDSADDDGGDGDGGDGDGDGASACAEVIGPDNAVLDQEVESLLATNHHAGMAICTIRDGAVTWCRGYGKANITGDVDVTARTPFMLASVSKLFTATALMQRYEAGDFELGDDVNEIATFPVTHPTSSTAIDYRMLLAHVSSIEDSWGVLGGWYEYGSDPTISLYDAISGYLDPTGTYYTDQNWGADAPGTYNSYSNVGYALVGLLTELHVGTDFAEYTKSTLFDPLGMNDTSWRLADHDVDTLAMPYNWQNDAYEAIGHYTFADYPNGALRASACDVALFLASQASGGAPLLESPTVAMMQEPAYPALSATQGLGWRYENLGPGDWIGHNGFEQGVYSDAYYRQSDKVGFVLLTNSVGDDFNAVYGVENSVITWAESL